MSVTHLVYPEESYALVGCAYAVYNSMGYGHHERNYQRAYALELADRKFCFEKELCVEVRHRGVYVGKYFLDFLVDEKIVVELKVGSEFHPNYIKQVLTYLHITNKRLGIIFLFTPEGLKYRRIVN